MPTEQFYSLFPLETQQRMRLSAQKYEEASAKLFRDLEDFGLKAESLKTLAVPPEMAKQVVALLIGAYRNAEYEPFKLDILGVFQQPWVATLAMPFLLSEFRVLAGEDPSSRLADIAAVAIGLRANPSVSAELQDLVSNSKFGRARAGLIIGLPRIGLATQALDPLLAQLRQDPFLANTIAQIVNKRK